MHGIRVAVDVSECCTGARRECCEVEVDKNMKTYKVNTTIAQMAGGMGHWYLTVSTTSINKFVALLVTYMAEQCLIHMQSTAEYGCQSSKGKHVTLK